MLGLVGLSLAAGVATCVGAGLVMLRRPTENSLAVFLGLAIGIMSGVVVMELIPSAFKYGSCTTTLIGVGFGLLILFILDNLLRLVMQTASGIYDSSRLLRMGLLIALGIALHDLPEGIAIAAGYSAEAKLGLVIVLAIGLHNIPEGMAFTAPLWMGGMRRRRIGTTTLLVAFITPLGTALGLWLIHVSPDLISVLLALAAGAMAYIVCLELLPEAVRCSLARSLLGTVAGLALISFVMGI